MSPNTAAGFEPEVGAGGVVLVVVVVVWKVVGGFAVAVEDGRRLGQVSSASSSATQALFAAQVGAVGPGVREAFLAIGTLVWLFT